MSKDKNSRNSEYYEGEFAEHYSPSYIKAVSRELRKNSTESEKRLWEALRNRQLAGLKFLRQHPFGRSVVDFYCHEKRLIIEVDGGIHRTKDMQEYDRIRQELIELRSVKFFRCTSEEVMSDLPKVLEGILVMAND